MCVYKSTSLQGRTFLTFILSHRKGSTFFAFLEGATLFRKKDLVQKLIPPLSSLEVTDGDSDKKQIILQKDFYSAPNQTTHLLAFHYKPTN